MDSLPPHPPTGIDSHGDSGSGLDVNALDGDMSKDRNEPEGIKVPVGTRMDKLVSELMARIKSVDSSQLLDQTKRIEQSIAVTMKKQQDLLMAELREKQARVQELEQGHNDDNGDLYIERIKALREERDKLKNALPEFAKTFKEHNKKIVEMEEELKMLDNEKEKLIRNGKSEYHKAETAVKLYKTTTHIEWEDSPDKNLLVGSAHNQLTGILRNIRIDTTSMDECDLADTLWNIIASV